MDSLLKAVKKSPIQRPFSRSSKSKHKKLGENWGENKEPVKEGVTFYVKYLGSTLVEELHEEGQSYGDSISSGAVKTIVNMAKAAGKKLVKMAITVTPNNIKVTNMATKEVYTDLTIYRICFCTADKTHDKVFAYIARNMENETMQCHAFLCAKKKIAQAVTLTVAQAFRIAQEDWEDEERRQNNHCRENQDRKAFGEDVRLHNGTPKNSGHAATGQLINIWGDSDSPADHGFPLSAERNASPDDSLGFEDNFTDEFASLAESRSRKENPFGKFSTGLLPEDIDEGVMQLMGGGGRSELARQPSMDDLLSL